VSDIPSGDSFAAAYRNWGIPLISESIWWRESQYTNLLLPNKRSLMAYLECRPTNKLSEAKSSYSIFVGG
jgi:hypothetical protein